MSKQECDHDYIPLPYKEGFVQCWRCKDTKKEDWKMEHQDNKVGLIQVRLETAQGDYIADVEVLPYPKSPDMLLWGERFFIYRGGKNGQECFREGFCCISFTETPGVTPKEIGQ